MKKENIVDLIPYCDHCAEKKPAPATMMSEELQKAIQNLIYRLRELGPIQRA